MMLLFFFLVVIVSLVGFIPVFFAPVCKKFLFIKIEHNKTDFFSVQSKRFLKLTFISLFLLPVSLFFYDSFSDQPWKLIKNAIIILPATGTLHLSYVFLDTIKGKHKMNGYLRYLFGGMVLGLAAYLPFATTIIAGL